MDSTTPIKISTRRAKTLSTSDSSTDLTTGNLSTSLPPFSTTLPESTETSQNITTTTTENSTTTTTNDTIQPSQNHNNNETTTTPVNIVIKACKNITSKQALLMIPITKFFSERTNLTKLIEILKGESVSLRLIDWFVTNYCKKYNIIYNTGDYTDAAIINAQNTGNTTTTITNPPSFDNFIIVHNNYKGQLKAYSKRNFDPFCRRNRIRFYYEDNKYFITTVGQLNFFKWALESNLINYITKHYSTIDDDMNNHGDFSVKKSQSLINIPQVNSTTSGDNTKKKKPTDGTIPIETAIKTKKNGGTRKKRTEISSSASKSLSIYNYPTTLVFD